ncbi:MAG: nitronate monooxygenase, partial [Myxococcales bacterium]|nr:nitronate monooxygenase [Myxococcales bacterium]
MPSSPLHTPLCDLLGMKHPIVQTGMGWVATPELVAAVCDADAFGFLAAATIPPPEVDHAIGRVQELTQQPFGVNFLI